MFNISIDVSELKNSLSDRRAGALVTFEGWVRDHNEGKSVIELEYEAYDALCANEAERILCEASDKFKIIAARCAHRQGKLAIGDLAVWVGVTSVHRADAFAACQYIIDEIKTRLPIWKKETYVDGTSGWVNCQHGGSGHRQTTHANGLSATSPLQQNGSLAKQSPGEKTPAVAKA